MTEISTVGVDLANSVYQVHGVDAEGAVVLRRQLKRSQMLEFFQELAPCLIGIEACAWAHCRARELGKLGHDVRLMPPSYVKPYVRSGKTDQADAEAICEAVTRPSMRFVSVKSEETQALPMTHVAPKVRLGRNAREFLVRQLTQVTNAIRAHLGEFGIVISEACLQHDAPKGVHNVARLPEGSEYADLPAAARVPLRLLADQFFETRDRIGALTRDIRREAAASDAAKRLQTIPGIGPITATALAATLPDTTGFRTSRDLSAWLGLTPKPHSSGGREKLRRVSKMGNRYLGRLLYLGAMGIITARRRREPGIDWLWRLLERKAARQAAVSLANRMARTVWALLRNGTSYNAARVA